MRSIRYLESFVFVFLLLAGFGFNKAHADHISSTEMYLDYIGTGPNDLRYKVTFVTFRVCIQNNLVLGPMVAINVKSANAGLGNQNNFSANLSNEVLRYDASRSPVYEDTLDNLCPNFSKINSCRVPANVNYSGYTMRRYSATVTLPSRQTDWVFSWTSCCRLLSYVNIDYSAGPAMYLEVGLNNLFKYNNSTPRYNGQPFAFLCANQPGALSNLPSDPNKLDSLVTTAIDPQQNASANIVYYSGYTTSRPLGTASGYNVGRVSGKARFTPPLQGKYALGFRTSDYDKATGTRMSYTTRDLVITVLNCTHQPPYIDSIPRNMTGVRQVDTTGGEVTIRACQLPLSFRINASSSTSGGLIKMRSVSTLPPGMSITPTITGSTGYLTVNWSPTLSDIGTHVVSLIAIDSTCALGQEITLRNEFTFTIIIDTTVKLPGSFTRLPACDTAQNRNPLSSSMPAGSYSWNTGDTVRTIYASGPGYYVCKNTNACTVVIDSFLVTMDVQSSLHKLPACDTDQNRNQLSSSLPSGSYKWNTGETAQTIFPTGPGYYVCIASDGCKVATDSFLVSADVYDSLYHVQVCDTANVTVLIVSPTVSPYYRWSTGESTRQIEVTRLGDFSCQTFNGCHVINETYRVAVDMPGPPIAYDTMICQYTVRPVIQIQDSGLVWYLSSSGGAGSSNQPLINTDEKGHTTLYVAKKKGSCTSERVPVDITINRSPKAHGRDTLVHCKGMVNYTISIGVAPVDEIYYKWSTGSNSSYIVAPTDGEYMLTSYNGCGAVTDTFSLQSVDCENCVRFPDAFSPNGDGLNDAFGALLRCEVDRFSLSIYNRWGQIVYSSRNQDGRWKGIHDGVAAPGGIYMYMASMYSERSGKRIFVKGEVTLIR